MSFLQCEDAMNVQNLLSPSQNIGIMKNPDGNNAQNLQIWNNAAFDDDEESAKRAASARPEFLQIQSAKENHSPNLCSSPVFDKSPVPYRLLTQGKPLKVLFKQGLLYPDKSFDQKKIDAEIEEIEREMTRLSDKLDALRQEKERRNVGRVLPANTTEKISTKTPKKIQESPASTNFRRRGVSLGPAEIAGRVRSRPAETPNTRRKSCFWKLPDIAEGEEDKTGKEKSNRSMSLSPKSRPSKICDPRRGISTVGSKKPARKDSTLLQPKKLFGDKPAAGSQKPLKNARFVPSRYSQIPARLSGNSPVKDRRKSLLPETDKRGKPRAVPSGVHRSRTADSGVRRRWDIPEGEEGSSSPPSIVETGIGDTLPMINTVRYVKDSPRDSGCAKRVADLVGLKTYFGSEDGEMATSVCQVLGFDENE